MQDPPSLPLFWARRRPAILPEFVKWAVDYLCGIAAKRLRYDPTWVTNLVIHSVYASIRSSFFGQVWLAPRMHCDDRSQVAEIANRSRN